MGNVKTGIFFAKAARRRQKDKEESQEDNGAESEAAVKAWKLWKNPKRGKDHGAD